MDYSIKEIGMLQKLIGQDLNTIQYYEIYPEVIWAYMYITIGKEKYLLSNNLQDVILDGGEEELTILSFDYAGEMDQCDGQLDFHQKIKEIILTNDSAMMENGFFHTLTKAITFVLENTTVTFTKESWVDEGMKIIYGNEWKDRISSYHTNIYDEEDEIPIQKSISYIEIR